MLRSVDNVSSYAAPRALTAILPARWLTPDQFETLVATHQYASHLADGGNLVFTFPDRAALPTSLGLWLLSFLNQLATGSNGRVHLEFASPNGLFGYLDRNGFLQLLAPQISTNPPRPLISGADVYRGRTQGLVEIVPLVPGVSGSAKQEIVGRLVDALIDFYPSGEERTRRLRNNVFTVLGELVDNVFSHSETTLPGYVGLQAYSKRDRPRIQIGVSDVLQRASVLLDMLLGLDSLRCSLQRNHSVAQWKRAICRAPSVRALVESRRIMFGTHC